MAFFEYLAAFNDLLSSALGKFIKPVGGQGSNSIFPNPKAGLPPNPGASNAGVLVQDADGALRARASIVTSRQELRDDFTGASLNTNLTGTLTFTAASTSVTGSGTIFTTELSRDFYIKVAAQGESFWAKVRRVISDTSLELESGYTGLAASGVTGNKTKWPTTTGSGGSFTVGSSLLNVLSGTTSGAQTFISRSFDAATIYAAFNGLTMTQRIANQTISVGLFDSVTSPVQQIALIFDGTTNTTLKFRTSFTATASDIQETVVTIPFGQTSAATNLNYVILWDGQQATLMIAGVVVASHQIHLAEPFTTLIAAVSVSNAATVTTTTVSVDSVYLKACDDLDLSTMIPAGGVLPTDEFHYVSGALTTTATTADQIIVSYTVPAGKVAYILAYFVTNNANTDGTPLKVGKNTITGEPAAPGTADGNILRTHHLERSSAGMYQIGENFPIPRPFGFAGDVIKIATTPSGTGSTVWRANLDIILRKI